MTDDESYFLDYYEHEIQTACQFNGFYFHGHDDDAEFTDKNIRRYVNSLNDEKNILKRWF